MTTILIFVILGAFFSFRSVSPERVLVFWLLAICSKFAFMLSYPLTGYAFAGVAGMYGLRIAHLFFLLRSQVGRMMYF